MATPSQNQNFGYAGAALTLLTVVLAPFEILLAFVSGAILVVVLFFWLKANGVRLRWPVYRRRPKVLTPTEEQTLAETRRVKDELTELLHARARPAVGKMMAIYRGLIEEFKRKPEPSSTLGALAGLYPVREVEEAEAKVRRVLEGTLWDSPDYADVNRHAREFDLEKQTPTGLVGDFYSYFVKYLLLSGWAKHLLTVLGGDPSTDARFIEWKRLHEQFIGRLRDALADPSIGPIRDDFEAAITKMDKA